MRYAAYGSNLHPLRLRERAASATLLGAANVAGWALRFHKRGRDGSAKCNIVPAGSSIYVAVYAIAPHHRLALDRVEGVNAGYEQSVLEVPAFGDCFTYRASETHVDDALQPFCWYKELVLTGCETLGFPDDYVAAIRALAHVADEDQDRRAQNMSLVARARRTARRGDGEWYRVRGDSAVVGAPTEKQGNDATRCGVPGPVRGARR